MEFTLPEFTRSETVTLQLRSLFELAGYKLFRMGSFEAYDFYMQNRSFLSSDDIITFTGSDGRLMALKPDVTLSIVKNTKPAATRRVYYNEKVFRKSRDTGEYREINQMGLEYIGGVKDVSEAEVVSIAAKSLSLAGEYSLDLSHMGFIEAVLAPFSGVFYSDALVALRNKNPQLMRQTAAAANLSGELTDKLERLAMLSGPFDTAVELANELASDFEDARQPLEELIKLRRTLSAETPEINLRLDFSILNDVDYYNGIIFQGFIRGIAHPVLAGGRYDNLMVRFGKNQGAVGFAVYLDELERSESFDRKPEDSRLNIALPKGRMGESVYAVFEKAGLGCEGILEESRKLIFEDKEGKVRYFLVKPSDVSSYVEHGAADIGVTGKDLLLETGADVLELADMGVGKCRIVVAGKPDHEENSTIPIRAATKYPNIARGYYAEKSSPVEIIMLHGSIELAPLTGLADVIVDIVESGNTLKENNLIVHDEISLSSARLIANRASWRFKQHEINALLTSLKELL